jgi:hypothetical protein
MKPKARARRRRGEAGAVTAEAAMAIPVLALVAAGLCWLVALGVAQVRAVDAARETARALARDEDRATALDLGRRVAPEGARFTVESGDGVVRVTVTARVRSPGGLLTFPAFDAHATAVAAVEEQS